MNTINKSLIVIAFLLNSNTLFASPYEQPKNIACPDAWSDTTEPIPVIIPSLEPWSDEDDRDSAKQRLATSGPIITIDNLPVTDEDLANDLLTVASECLVYRNLMVDTSDYVPTPSKPNYDNGWLPASIF